MEVVTLQVFVSLVLVASSLLLFAFAFRQRDFEHADRLALLPLEPSESGPAQPPIESPTTPTPHEDDHRT